MTILSRLNQRSFCPPIVSIYITYALRDKAAFFLLCNVRGNVFSSVLVFVLWVIVCVGACMRACLRVVYHRYVTCRWRVKRLVVRTTVED